MNKSLVLFIVWTTAFVVTVVRVCVGAPIFAFEPLVAYAALALLSLESAFAWRGREDKKNIEDLYND